MNHPLEYYQKNLKVYQEQAIKLNKQIALLSMLRVLVFLVACFGIYLVFHQWQLAVSTGIAGIFMFTFLLSKYTNKKEERDLNKALIKINEEEINIITGNYQYRAEGQQFQETNHFYSLDIDLFGRGSFFQYINRTTINEGTTKLANELKANNINDIELRQEAVKELSEKANWRQFYSATSSLVSVETPAQNIIKWLKSHKPFLPKTMVWFPAIFGIISLAMLGLTIFNVIDKSLIVYWLLIGLGFTGIYLKKINNLASNSDKVKDTLLKMKILLQNY